jgi:hypothetical protein
MSMDAMLSRWQSSLQSAVSELSAQLCNFDKEISITPSQLSHAQQMKKALN